MKSRRVATFAEEGKWTSGSDSTLLVGDWQAWVDGEGHWKVRGPDPDNEAHYAGGDIELTEAEDIEAGNSEARRKIRARRAKEAARAYIRSMARAATAHHATKKSPAQLQREIDESLGRSSGLSKHHLDLLSRRNLGGGLRAGYLTPAGWHGDPMVIEDPRGRLEALREQAAPKFPKDPGRRAHSTKQAKSHKSHSQLNREIAATRVPASAKGDRVLADLKSWGIDREQLAEVREAFHTGDHRRAMALARDLGWNRASKRGRAFR